VAHIDATINCVGQEFHAVSTDSLTDASHRDRLDTATSALSIGLVTLNEIPNVNTTPVIRDAGRGDRPRHVATTGTNEGFGHRGER
jgi:hypothetical protein